MEEKNEIELKKSIKKQDSSVPTLPPMEFTDYRKLDTIKLMDRILEEDRMKKTGSKIKEDYEDEEGSKIEEIENDSQSINTEGNKPQSI